MQSRHPGVCQWINDAVAAVEAELLKGTVARVALVIWEMWWESEPSSGASGGDGSGDGASETPTRGEGAKPLERYVWDVSRWPVIPKNEHNTPFTRSSPASNPANQQQTTNDQQGQQQEQLTDEERRAKFAETLKQAHSDLHEQLRALLSRLSTISGRLKPLPSGADRCTYTLALELKEESDPPIGHPQAWIPSERGMQRRIVHQGDDGEDGHEQRGEDAVSKPSKEKEGGRLIERGEGLGGVRTTPVRTVESGEMIFEMWIEEGRSKFDNRYTTA